MPYSSETGQWIEPSDVGDVVGSMKAVLGGDKWPDWLQTLWDVGGRTATRVITGAEAGEAKVAQKEAAVNGKGAVASTWWQNPLWLLVVGGIAFLLWRGKL